MLQRYKLRLGDGTVLLVDRDSLGTWLVDRSAAVQSDTSGRWRPLKEVVARQRAAARREARRSPSVHESAPPRRASSPRDESEPLTPTPRADGLPLIPPPPKRNAPPRTEAPSLRADGLPLVFPPPRGARPETPAPPAPAAGPAVSEDAIMPPPEAAPPLPDPAPVASPEATAGGPDMFSFDPATLIEPASAAADVAEGAEGDPAPTVIVGVPQTVLAEGDDVEVIDTLPAVEPGVPAQDDTAGEALAVQAVGDAILPTEAPRDEAAAIRRLPVIRLKPVEESRPERPTPEADRAGESRPRVRSAEETAATTRSSRAHVSQPEEDPPAWAGDSRVTAALRWTGALGGALSRGLEPLNRLERGQPPIVVEEGALTRARNAVRQRLEGAGEWLGSVWDRVGSGARPVEAEASEPNALPPSIERAPWPTPAPPLRPPTPLLPPRPDPGLPPPPIERLAVLPVAEALDAPHVEEIYEDAEIGDLLPRVWQWTKAVALLAALAAAGSYAAMSWRTWFPTAGHMGQMAFEEIDRHARAGERAEQLRRIQEEAAERLPFLAPETVLLIVAKSPTGILEVPDIFEAACDAADWGSWALSPAEADELRRLRGLAIRTLGPVDRARVDEYERARANGLVFPLDNRLGALLWARGARGLPPPDQERLRELLGKAITAGISPASAVAARTARP